MASRPSRRQDLTSVRSHDGFRAVVHTLMRGKKETEMELSEIGKKGYAIKKPYDVFISYRRKTGVDDARLLQQALKARGYEVFFDYDSLRVGKFNEKIFEAIDEAPVFIFMLTEESLDRCVEDGDWVRAEIERAIDRGRQITPVLPSGHGLSFPDNLPIKLRVIPSLQVQELNKTSLFEESVDKIVENCFPDNLKKKRVSVDQIPSTVSKPSRVFVGRDGELTNLHAQLAAGKIPVVTAPGGTGKSELVRQYAVKYRAEYPGGLFQIDMEKAGDWDDALNRLLTPASAPGVDVRGILDLKNKGGDGNKEGRSELLMEDVVGGLRRRGEQFGRILLVLDNVESTKEFLHESVISRLNLSSDIALVATARTSDIIFRKTDSAIELQLQDLSIGAAVELLLKDNPAETAAERKAAENIARLLGCRALHLRAVPALINDPYSPYAGSYVELESELRKSFSETIDSAMEDYGEGARKPSALWDMTSKSLARHPHGQSWVRLAHVASFFSPEGFQKHVLRYLWGKLIAPDADSDLRFNQALEVLRRHGIISDSESELRMHRLTIAALRHSAREAEVDIEESIGKSLAMYEGMMPEDWLSLAGSIRIIHCIPDKIRVSKIDKIPMQVRLLCSNSEFEKECRWEVFTSRDWRRLLCLQAQYADRCPWDKIKRDDWVLLLCRQPQFADRYSLDRLRGSDWVQLLEFQPKFADRCTWKKLNGKDWARLLEFQPKFADRCPWEKLNWRACVRLLESQPQLEDSCPWWKFEGADWVSLLEDHPKFADHCSWWKLNGADWASLLPLFADRCSWWKLSGSDWAFVLAHWQEEFGNRCPWDKLSGTDWVSLLNRLPEYADRCSWDKLSGRDWAYLLSGSNGVRFVDSCPWDKLSGSDWVSLLQDDSDFSKYCLWDKLTGRDWVRLLCNVPQHFEFYWGDEFSDSDGTLLFGGLHGAQYVDQCSWDKFSGSDWVLLLCSSLGAQYADRCPWDKLSGSDWVHLLQSSRGAQYADRCPWDKLSGSDWVSLIHSSRGAQYADRCPWEQIDANDWGVGLDLHPQLIDWRTCSELELFFKKWGAWVTRNDGSDVSRDLSDLLTISCGLAETIPAVFNTYEANILDQLAEFHESEGEFRCAVEELSKSIKIRCAGPEFRKDDSVTLGVAHSLGRLGVLHRILGDFDKSEIVFVDALDLIRDFAPHHYSFLILLGKIQVEFADLHRDVGKYDQAESEYEQSLALCCDEGFLVTLQGDDQYRRISSALTGLGVLHSMLEDLDKAEAELKEALAIREYLVKSNPELEKQLAESLYEYGKMLIKRGDRDKAKTNLKRALDIRLRLAQNAPKVFAKAVEETESILKDLQKDSMN